MPPLVLALVLAPVLTALVAAITVVVVVVISPLHVMVCRRPREGLLGQ
jgi:hypothetical protein